MKQPNVLTTAEVARLKGISRQAVSQAIDRGTLNAVKMGHTLLVLRDGALAAYLAAPPQPNRKQTDGNT